MIRVMASATSGMADGTRVLLRSFWSAEGKSPRPGLPCDRRKRSRRVRRGDLVTPSQIRNRPRDFEDAMECPCGELQLLHRRPHERLAGRIQPAKDSNIGGPLRVSALHTTRLSCEAKRLRCRSRAASTRAATTDDGSPNRSPVSFSRGAGTRGTSTRGACQREAGRVGGR
jgi:hypothetical protein